MIPDIWAPPAIRAEDDDVSTAEYLAHVRQPVLRKRLFLVLESGLWYSKPPDSPPETCAGESEAQEINPKIRSVTSLASAPSRFASPSSNPLPVKFPEWRLYLRDWELLQHELMLSEVVREGLEEEMERDNRVCVMGEDVGCYGGSNKVTKGLAEKFGDLMVLDTPIAENS
ncbi:unnamed protein product [Linum tenue]|uniref:pyruvate dehydrogenase (acetyl-transferring) n=1 Tax=Linum tenue TaxID=586396 RepID=A0AAV0IP86_9ROSI|nr:unnamed protein product [Linum tenue]